MIDVLMMCDPTVDEICSRHKLNMIQFRCELRCEILWNMNHLAIVTFVTWAGHIVTQWHPQAAKYLPIVWMSNISVIVIQDLFHEHMY